VPAGLLELPLPALHDWPQHRPVAQQPVQRREILRQLPHLDRERLVPQALLLLRQKRQHTSSQDRPETHSLPGIFSVVSDGNSPPQTRYFFLTK
jgi:hypothetical protein